MTGTKDDWHEARMEGYLTPEVPGEGDSPSKSPGALSVAPMALQPHSSVVSPSGMEIEFWQEPKRMYRVRDTRPEAGLDDKMWLEVPSVTTVLGVLDKSAALTWWSQGIGVEGVAELVRRGLLVWREG